MATVLDYLSAPAFTDDRLTEAINIPPAVTGRLAQLGLYADTPILTTYAKIGVQSGTLAIIPARERGGEHNKNMRGDRREIMVGIPHFPLDDAITPSDLQNILVYGDGYVMQALSTVYNDKLTNMRAKHDLTHAHLDWAGINGLYVDAENKQLLDLYSHFGLTKQTIDFELDSGSTDVAAKNRILKAAIRTKLLGAASTGIRIFASPGWYDAYVGHAFVKDALKAYQGPTQNPARDDIAEEFRFAGAVLERVEEEFPVRLADGTFEMRPAVPANEAIAVPLGTPYFRRYVAPPDTIFDANRAPSPAAKVFVSTNDLPHGKGRDIHTESNVLPICLRPEVMVRLTLT